METLSSKCDPGPGLDTADWQHLDWYNQSVKYSVAPLGWHLIALSIKIAQKPYTIGPLGPKALKYESFEDKG